MIRSGLILGVVMLFVGGIAAFSFPFCAPCLALLLGTGAGYLAGMWDKPLNNSLSMQRGAGAGAIAGVGALFGHVFGALGAAAFAGTEGGMELLRSFGLDPGATADISPAAFYVSAGFTGCCFGLFEVALMAALGAVGGILWWNLTGKNRGGMSAMPPEMPA